MQGIALIFDALVVAKRLGGHSLERQPHTFLEAAGQLDQVLDPAWQRQLEKRLSGLFRGWHVDVLGHRGRFPVPDAGVRGLGSRFALVGRSLSLSLGPTTPRTCVTSVGAIFGWSA